MTMKKFSLPVLKDHPDSAVTLREAFEHMRQRDPEGAAELLKAGEKPQSLDRRP